MRHLIVPALAALATLAACQHSRPAAAPDDVTAATTPAVHTEPDAMPATMVDEATRNALVPGNNRFAWSLFDALDEKDGNVFVSPASVSGAFGLLYPGARADTATQMASVFGYDVVPSDLFPAAEHDLSTALLSDTDTAKMTIANAVWLRQSSTLQEAYRAAVQGIMKAKVELIDFDNPPAAAARINEWVERKTNDRIKDLVPASAIKPGLTELILTNAIWFKADWKSPFKAEATSDGPFHAPSGEVTARLMSQTLKKARHLSRDGYAALDLDYDGDDYALTVILPEAQDGLAEVAAAMDPDQFTRLLSDMDSAPEKRVHVVLPKLKIEADYQLNEALIGLGLGVAFGGGADFSGLIEGAGPGDLVISQVLHKTFLEIDEKGTEAAAATAIIMQRTAAIMPHEDPIEFRADHPFLIALRHKPTGAVVFIGRVENPVAG